MIKTCAIRNGGRNATRHERTPDRRRRLAGRVRRHLRRARTVSARSALRAELARLLASRDRIAAQLAIVDRIVEEKTAAFARERGLPFLRRERLPYELSRAANEEKYLRRVGKAGRDGLRSARQERAA